MFANLSRPANNVGNLVEQLKLQINNVKDIVGDRGDHAQHSVLAATVDLVKSVLFERDSDGLEFKLSNRSERKKLLYHYKKAVVILNKVTVTGSQHQEEQSPHVSTFTNDVGHLVEQLKLQINNVNDTVGDHDAHSVLAGTVERVNSALSERDSDGLGYKISNRSEREKLMYQYNKAVAIMNKVTALKPSQQLVRQDDILSV